MRKILISKSDIHTLWPWTKKRYKLNILTFKTFAFDIQPRSIPQCFDVMFILQLKIKLQFHETQILIVVFVYDDRSRVLSLHNLCILRSRCTAWKLFCKSFKVIENIFCGSSGIQCKMLVSAARERNEMKWRKPNIH